MNVLFAKFDLKNYRASRHAVAAGIGLVLSLGLCGLAPAARAQGAFDMGMLTNTLAQGAITQSEGERARRTSGRHGHNAHKIRRLNSKTTQAAFTPSAAVRKHSIIAFLERVRKADPQTASSLEQQFASKDIFGNLAQQLSKYGMKTTSVTDAFTVYMVTAWQGVRGQNGDLNKAYVRGVRDQMSHVLANIPAVAFASDAKKQELADAFLLQALLIDSTVAGAKKQPALMPQVKASLVAGTRATVGYDLTQFKLSEKGLHL